MGPGLILDTSVLVEFERGHLDWGAVGDADSDVAIAALTVAEFRVGIELAKDRHQRAKRLAALDAILAGVEVLGYDAETAAWHARLLAHSRAAGLVRGAHDLIIAAHAAQTGRLLVSADAKAAFAALPGVRVHQVRPGV